MSYPNLGAFSDSLAQSLEQQRQQKLRQAQELIASGAYSPTQGGQQPGLLGRIGGNVFGPTTGQPNMNMGGQNYAFQTPEMKAKAMQDQMQAYSGLLGNNGSGGAPSFDKEVSIDPMSGQAKISLKSKAQDTGMGGLTDVGNKTPEQLQAEMKEKNPAYANYLQSLADGRFTLTGRSTKQALAIQKDLANMYPGMDQSKINARYKTRQDFTTGKSAQNIKSLNTAVQHLAELNKIIPDLHNVQFPVVGKMWNRGKNLAMAESGNPTISRFKAIKNALSGELANIYKISGGTDTEIKHVGDTIDDADSTEGLNASVQEAITLMGGRLSALQDQWHNSYDMPTDTDFPVISPKSKATLASIGYDNENNTVKNASPDQSQGFQTTPSGLKYRIIQ